MQYLFMAYGHPPMSFKSLAKEMPVLYYIIVMLYCMSNNDTQTIKQGKVYRRNCTCPISKYLKIFSTFGLMKPKDVEVWRANCIYMVCSHFCD